MHSFFMLSGCQSFNIDIVFKIQIFVILFILCCFIFIIFVYLLL